MNDRDTQQALATARAEGFAAGVERSAQILDAAAGRAELGRAAQEHADFEESLSCEVERDMMRDYATDIRALSPLRPVAEVCVRCGDTGEVVCKHDNGITCVRNSREGGPCPHDDPFHGGRCHVPCPACAEEPKP